MYGFSLWNGNWKIWVLVPETVKFNLVGKLPEGVYARDLILTIIGEIGANGCNYQVMEFTGEGAKSLSISERMVLCNMAVEAGAKTGIFEADEKALEYLEAHAESRKLYTRVIRMQCMRENIPLTYPRYVLWLQNRILWIM